MASQFVFEKFIYFQILAGSIEDISIGTIVLMLSYVFAFPAVSGIIIFYITRGVLRNMPKTKNSKHVRRLYWSISFGGAALILLFAVLQVRNIL